MKSKSYSNSPGLGTSRDDKRISIIIPVYNTPIDWLKACFDSAASQDYDNYEVILVDDGSCVGTAFDCDSLGLSGKCETLVVHQENKGLSGARNVGISKSTGDYILFLDSDDELSDTSVLKRFAEPLGSGNEIDVVVGSFHLGNRGNDIAVEGEIAGPEALAVFVEHEYSFQAVDMLFSRRLLDSMPRLFIEGLVHEDEEFTPRAIYGAQSVVFLKGDQTYIRVVRDGSLTTARDEVSSFRRCLGKFRIAEIGLDEPMIDSDSTVGKQWAARCFSLANMAFKAWATEIHSGNLQSDLLNYAERIDYRKCPFLVDNRYHFRTWLCMSVVSMIGPSRYVGLIRRIGRLHSV